MPETTDAMHLAAAQEYDEDIIKVGQEVEARVIKVDKVERPIYSRASPAKPPSSAHSRNHISLFIW